MYCYVLLAACVACTMAHPKYLECGSAETSKLRAGQKIMTQIVTQDSGDGDVKIIADHDTVTVTSSNPEQRFALKAWGDGAELKSCSSGLTQTKAGGLFGQKCASQFYMNDYLPNSPSFTCRHTGAIGFAVVYAKQSFGGVLLATHGTQPTDTIRLSSNLTEAVGDSLTSFASNNLQDLAALAKPVDSEAEPAAAQCPQYCDDASDCTPECSYCYEVFTLDKLCHTKPKKPCAQEGQACSSNGDCCSCMSPLGIGLLASCNSKQCACPNQTIV